MPRRALVTLTLVLAALHARHAAATWSIVVADRETKEVGIASVTCLTGYDLRAITPVMLVGVGGAAVQARGDFDGLRRPVIHREFLTGTSPGDLITVLAGIGGHEERQYGIADTQGRSATFSGSGNAAWAGGVIGETGTLVHAIQGNILAGDCVVPVTETTLARTVGDVPAKLMAAMEAARLQGGDGRCSCSPGDATGCGCPPPGFSKSGHIGYLLVARIGDTDDPTCDVDGCADGDYFLNLNFAFQPGGNPDPVEQMRAAFDAWRAGLDGRPDAIQSQVTITADGAEFDMEVLVRDWSGAAPTLSPLTVTVDHEPDSAGINAIGPVADEGGGRFTLRLTPGAGSGLDRYRVTVDDGMRPVILMPSPELCVGDPCICLPGDPANDVPGTTTALRLDASGTVTWSVADRAFLFNLRSGSIADIQAGRGVSGATCIASDLTGASFLDARPLPGEPGDGFYYLAEGRNGCGDGGSGLDSAGASRATAPCP